jgi:hypothetical protein
MAKSELFYKLLFYLSLLVLLVLTLFRHMTTIFL